MGLFSKNSDEQALARLKQQNEQLNQQLADIKTELANKERRLTDLQRDNDEFRIRQEDILTQRDNLRLRLENTRDWDFFEDLSAKQHHYLYKLLLDDGCYYVGETTDLRRRLMEHYSGQSASGFKGARWPVIHHPQYLIGLRCFDRTAKTYSIDYVREQEDLETINLMKRFGFEKVRGGHFASEKDEYTLKYLAQADYQQKYGYQLKDLGITEVPVVHPKPTPVVAKPASAATKLAPAAAKPKAPKPAAPTSTQSTDDQALSALLVNPAVHLDARYNVLNADPETMIIVAVAHENERLIFTRQRQYLLSAFNRIKAGKFRVADDNGDVTRFDKTTIAFVGDAKTNRDQNYQLIREKTEYLTAKGFKVYQEFHAPKKSS